MIKQITILLLLLISVGSVSATHEIINETLFIYNASDLKIHTHGSLHGAEGALGVSGNNINKVVCVNATCSEMHISIGINSEYDFEYDLHYAPNETVYYSKILRITQTVYDTSWFGLQKKITRTLYIDGTKVASYNLTQTLATGTTSNIQFRTLDQTINFGSETVTNTTLFFSEMTMDDSYNSVYNRSGTIEYKFKTIGDGGYTRSTLGGFTGIVLSGIKKTPLIGDALYNVVYPVVVLIQYSIDASFLILNLIMQDWWYAILLLECICMACALTQGNYIDMMTVYVNTHVSIFVFLYHKVVLPLLTMFISLLNTIKNMLQWW